MAKAKRFPVVGKKSPSTNVPPAVLTEPVQSPPLQVPGDYSGALNEGTDAISPPADARATRRWMQSMQRVAPDETLRIGAFFLGAIDAPCEEEQARLYLLRFRTHLVHPWDVRGTEADSVSRAVVLITRLQSWTSELRRPETQDHRRREIAKDIDRMYSVLGPVREDNQLRAEIAERVRAVATFHIAEVLARLGDHQPERAERIRQHFGPWLRPPGVALAMLCARWPSFAPALEAAEANDSLITRLIDAWRIGRDGLVNKQNTDLLDSLFVCLGMKCDIAHFAVKYRDWHKHAIVDESQNRLSTWTRLSVLLEDSGVSDGGVAAECERLFQEITRVPARPGTSRS